MVSGLVTYPASGLIGLSIHAAHLTPGWSIALWVIGGISLSGFVLGFVSEWIAIHYFDPCCTTHFSSEARKQVPVWSGRSLDPLLQYCGSSDQRVIDSLVVLLSLSIYACVGLVPILIDNPALGLFSRVAQWLRDVAVVGWILGIVGGLFILATFKELVVYSFRRLNTERFQD